MVSNLCRQVTTLVNELDSLDSRHLRCSDEALSECFGILQLQGLPKEQRDLLGLQSVPNNLYRMLNARWERDAGRWVHADQAKVMHSRLARALKTLTEKDDKDIVTKVIDDRIISRTFNNQSILIEQCPSIIRTHQLIVKIIRGISLQQDSLRILPLVVEADSKHEVIGKHQAEGNRTRLRALQYAGDDTADFTRSNLLSLPICNDTSLTLGQHTDEGGLKYLTFSCQEMPRHFLVKMLSTSNIPLSVVDKIKKYGEEHTWYVDLNRDVSPLTRFATPYLPKEPMREEVEALLRTGLPLNRTDFVCYNRHGCVAIGYVGMDPTYVSYDIPSRRCIGVRSVEMNPVHRWSYRNIKLLWSIPGSKTFDQEYDIDKLIYVDELHANRPYKVRLKHQPLLCVEWDPVTNICLINHEPARIVFNRFRPLA